MRSEKMVEFSYRCKCGAMVQGWSAKQLTDVEIASLKERDCDACAEKVMSPIYVVHAKRWGDCEKHSYIVLATNYLDDAIKAANDCEIGRGGKYGCEISCFNCGKKNIIRKPYDGIEPLQWRNRHKRGKVELKEVSR